MAGFARAGTLAAAAVGVVLACGACVERKLVIRSQPPGALVTLEDGPPAGRTPLEVPIEFDGERRVTLQAPGHRVLETTAVVDARWYDYFPLDAFAQFLWPGTIRDVRTFDYKLEAYAPFEQKFTAEQIADQRERLVALRERAETYRAGGSQGPSTAPPPAATKAGEAPPPPPPPRGTKPADQPAEVPAPAPGVPPREAAPVPPPELPPARPAAPRPPKPKPQEPEPEDEPVKPPKPGEPLPPPRTPRK